jgi:hypothetical protein
MKGKQRPQDGPSKPHGKGKNEALTNAPLKQMIRQQRGIFKDQIGQKHQQQDFTVNGNPKGVHADGQIVVVPES